MYVRTRVITVDIWISELGIRHIVEKFREIWISELGIRPMYIVEKFKGF